MQCIRIHFFLHPYVTAMTTVRIQTIDENRDKIIREYAEKLLSGWIKSFLWPAESPASNEAVRDAFATPYAISLVVVVILPSLRIHYYIPSLSR